MNNQIAILGWGSLIYELDSLKKYIELPWHGGGPKLPIEFSRISTSRDRALTLVIDPQNGVETPTQYILSSRETPKDAALDLREREGTNINRIGIIDIEESYEYSQFPKIAKIIKQWINDLGFRAVIWTDLPSNFKENSDNNNNFSIENAINHLNGLSKSGEEKAKKYFRKVPKYVVTPLREKLIADNWY